ncbi:MAG: hypothetical protein M1816_005312 [Peltula sp. TS41687]|nr:MAG: hypothetical protein M1816_005312 [Peltula sp. TS41687]
MDTSMVEPQDEARSPEALFANVNFSIIPSQNLPEQNVQEISDLLENNGGTYVPLDRETGKVQLDQITHIISTSSDFPSYAPAIDALISVVKPGWVYTSISKKRLAQIRPYSPDPRLIFAGVTICCADLPPGDKDAIIGGVVAMGGQYSGSLSKLVTHIVALTDQHEKCQQAIARKLKCCIVLPHWFDDCLKLGRRINEKPYRLPNPEITRVNSTDPVQLPSDTHLIGASSPQPGNLPSPKSPSPARADLTVFRGKRIMLSQDLDLGSRLRRTIEDLIENGAGAVTGNVHKADIYVCQYREGEEYRTASCAGKEVGNLPWLYYLIAHDEWTSPLRRLLHYPIARGGLPNFRKYRISLSNYGGEARLYLENLVVAAGGEFTKTLRQDNTHLITARPYSEKCQAAKEWNIHMVNHLWLEESYARWEEQSLTNPRYNHFPARTNLGEVVGQTQIDRRATESIFYPHEEPETNDEEQTKMRANVDAINRVRLGKDNLAFRAPEDPFKGTTARTTQIGKLNEARRPRTPLASRLSTDGRTNQTPSTTGSRGAKDRAVLKLHDLASDIALYEKERRRVGGVTHGGRRSNGDAATGSKRSLSRQLDTEDSELEDGVETRDRKKVKKSKAPPPSIRILVTSYRSWIGQPKREDEEKRKLRDLGILVVQDPSTCTHLAAPSMIRTQKFVTALAYAPVVVSSDFLDHCIEKGEVPAAEKYHLKDPETEGRLGIKLKDSLANARRNERRLLKDITVYSTPNVHGGAETYKAIVEANGGTCVPFRARHGAIITSSSNIHNKTTTTTTANDDDDGGDGDGAGGKTDQAKEDAHRYVYLLSGDAKEDTKLWPKFRQMARENGLVPRIVKTEWILDVAMSQELRWQDDYQFEGSA